jgi:hypothetical protein
MMIGISSSTMAIRTPTDPSGAYSWRIRDMVDRLRIWAESTGYPLPAEDDHEEPWIIGSSEDAWLQLPHEDALISRRHAALTRDDAGWQLADLNSKNGTSLDGEKLPKFILVPGAEVRIGRLALVAESRMLRELQEILHRLIGWADDRRADIDVALRGIRMAATRHEPLVLCADDSHIAIARLLHAYIVGVNRPFVVCERRSTSKPVPQRARLSPRPTTYDEGMPALAAAAGGTLVVRRNRLPADFEQVLAKVRGGERVLLIVCAPSAARSVQIHAQLVVPSLDSRIDELDRIIDAYAVDAPVNLGGPITAEERAWVKAQPKLSFASIETGTRRALAFRAAEGEVTRAAGLAEVKHGSLSTWLARRRDLPAYEADDEFDNGDDD